MAAYGEILLV